MAIPRRISRRDPENKFLNGIPLRRKNAESTVSSLILKSRQKRKVVFQVVRKHFQEPLTFKMNCV